MKSIIELNALIPSIIDLMNSEEPQIGNYDDNEYLDNSFMFEEDGWLIEIDYSCTGNWDIEPETYWEPGCCEIIDGWGKVDEIRASYFDENTEEYIEFSKEDLTDFYEAINKNLEAIV